MNRRRLTDDDMKTLIKELSVLRERGLLTIDVDTQSKPRKEFPTLEALAWDYLSLNSRRERTRVRAIRALLADAIGLIEESNYRADASTLFLLDDANSTPAEARDKVVERGNRRHMDKRRRFGYEEEIRSVLAERISDLVSSVKSSRVNTTTGGKLPPLRDDSFYVSRESIESEIQTSIDRENHCVVLYGEGGTGKSKLAEKLAQYYDDRVWITADQNTFLLDIYDALKSRGFATETMGEVALKAEFSALLRDHSGPAIVIIDDVSSESFVEHIVPQLHVSSVIVTARRSLDLKIPARNIRVGSLNETEAMHLVAGRLSRASQEMQRMLAHTLQGWPLAIDQVACFLDSYPDIDIREFCDELIEAPRESLELAGLQVGTFATILRSTVERAAKDNSFSKSVLEFFAMAHYQAMSTEFVALYLRAHKRLSKDISIAAASSTLQFLERLALVEKTKHGYSMHSLTHDTMREVLGDGIDENDMYAAMLSVGHFLHTRWGLRVATEDDYEDERRCFLTYEPVSGGRVSFSHTLDVRDTDDFVPEVTRFFCAFGHYLSIWTWFLNRWVKPSGLADADMDSDALDAAVENLSDCGIEDLKAIVNTVGLLGPNEEEGL